VKRNYRLLTLLSVLAVAGWYWRNSANIVESPEASPAALLRTANAPSAAAAHSGNSESKIIVQAPVEANKPPIASGSGMSTVESVPQMREPLSPEQARIAEMMSRRNFARSIAETANADEVELNAFSLLLVNFCMKHTAAPAKAQADAGGPSPNSLSANPSTTADGLRADAISSRRLDNARFITESCKDFNEGSGQSYADVAMTRLTAKASNATLVLIELGPQLDYKALSPRQFSVIADAMNEKNMASLELLGAQIAPALSNTFAEGKASEGAAGGLAWQLALCQLGAYCGRGSLAVREACWRYGACAGEDLASAVHAAMVRDGLPSTALDKQVNLFVKAINTKDPELLGIRRK
jgi:hypothetical protein